MSEAMCDQAGEYALGTLDPLEREAVARARARDATLDAEIRDWEARLMPLLEGIPSMQPSAELWAGIQARMQDNKSARDEGKPARLRGMVRPLAYAACLALAFFLGFALRMPAPPDAVALLQKNPAQPAFALHVHRGRLFVHSAAAPPKNASYELWVIQGPETPPRSLGILTAANTELPYPASGDRYAAASGATFAISQEPAGGSPTGQPTGPIVSTGEATAF